MMVGEVGEDKFEADFDDEKSNDEANVGFEVDVGEEIEDGGEEDGDADPGVV